MSVPVPKELVLLDELALHPSCFGGVPQEWEIRFARWNRSEELIWSFSPKSEQDLPSAYEASIRQRYNLLKGDGTSYGATLCLVEPTEREGRLRLVDTAKEGEPLPWFLHRTAIPYSPTFLSLMVGVIEALQKCESIPRILSNIRLDDFFVVDRAGVRFDVELVSPFCLIREEKSLQDSEIAKRWVETIATYCCAVKDCFENELDSYLPKNAKPFRRLLNSLHKGKERALAEYFQEIKKVLLSEINSFPVSTRSGDTLSHPLERPAGPLSEMLRKGMQRSYPEKISQDDSGSIRSAFSSFQAGGSDSSESDKGEQRTIYLLPPEKWFQRSLLDPVNRKITNPYLKAHHNSTCIRSLYCEEDFTALVADPAFGIPLPSVLQFRKNLEIAEITLLAGKLCRALDHFESAHYVAEIESPWQLELHPSERVSNREELNKLVVKDLREWPAWDVKIRVERPAESFLGDSLNRSWWFVQERLLAKSFPAFLLWMLEWERLEYLAASGALVAEPLSRNPNVNTLFLAAMEHFASGNAAHRNKLLEFTGEVMERVSPA